MKQNSKKTTKATKEPKTNIPDKKTIKPQKVFSPHDRFFK